MDKHFVEVDVLVQGNKIEDVEDIVDSAGNVDKDWVELEHRYIEVVGSS